LERLLRWQPHSLACQISSWQLCRLFGYSCRTTI